MMIKWWWRDYDGIYDDDDDDYDYGDAADDDNDDDDGDDEAAYAKSIQNGGPDMALRTMIDQCRMTRT